MPREDYSVQADEWFELDNERILVLIHDSGLGRAGGPELGESSRTSAGVRDPGRKVRRLDIYSDREPALAELGLASEPSATD
jgi:hypothetical protein